MFRALCFALVLVGSSIVWAAPPKAPFKAANGQVVRVRVNGDSKAGLQLRAEDAGWPLKVEGNVALMKLSAIDVTPGTPAQTLLVRVSAGEVLFDAQRFQAGHVYRVSNADGATYVYLQPSASATAAQQKGPLPPGHVNFEEGERAVAEETGIEPSKKGSL